MRAAVYIRKSREAEGPAHRLELQREALPEHARAQGWQVVVYDEGTASAARGCPLPERDRLEAEIRAGQVDLVLCIELSRLSRDATLEDYTRWLALCGERHVRLATPSRVLDPSHPSDWMLLLLEGGFSSVEMKVLAARMAEGRARAWEAGAWPGGSPPRGYRLENGRPVIVPEEAAEVVEALERVAAGEAVWGVARELGLRYNTVYGWVRHKVDTYAARRESREHPGTWLDCQWEPLISRALADRVRASMRGRRRGPRSNRPAHLLTGGVLRCGACGGSYQSHDSGRVRRDGSRALYYLCSQRRLARSRCPTSPSVQRERVDDAVVRHLFLGTDEAKHWRRYWEARQAPAAAQLARAERRIRTAELQRGRVVDAIAHGVLTLDLAAQKLRDIEGRLQRATAERDRLRRARSGGGPPWELLAELPQIWNALDLSQRREIVTNFVEAVHVYPGRLVLTYHVFLDAEGTTTAEVPLA